MNILAIGAHPDDIELGCAGTLIRSIRAGHQVYLLIMSDGRGSGDPKMRKAEQEESARMLKVKEVFWGNCVDTQITVNQDLVQQIEAVITRVKPDEIYVNFSEDSHQDHRAVAQALVSAARNIPRVLFYEDYTSLNFEPDIYVDITNVLEEKIRVIKSHQTQTAKRKSAGLDILESVRAIAHFRGFQGKTQYAEGFKALRYLKVI